MQTHNQFDLSHAPVHIQGHVEKPLFLLCPLLQ